MEDRRCFGFRHGNRGACVGVGVCCCDPLPSGATAAVVATAGPATAPPLPPLPHESAPSIRAAFPLPGSQDMRAMRALAIRSFTLLDDHDVKRRLKTVSSERIVRGYRQSISSEEKEIGDHNALRRRSRRPSADSSQAPSRPPDFRQPPFRLPYHHCIRPIQSPRPPKEISHLNDDEDVAPSPAGEEAAATLLFGATPPGPRGCGAWPVTPLPRAPSTIILVGPRLRPDNSPIEIGSRTSSCCCRCRARLESIISGSGLLTVVCRSLSHFPLLPQ